MRRTTLGCLTLLLLITAAPKVTTMPIGGSYTEYYSDDTYTTVVGEYYYGCSGTSRWGIRTNYYYQEGWDCGGSYHNCGWWGLDSSGDLYVWSEACKD